MKRSIVFISGIIVGACLSFCVWVYDYMDSIIKDYFIR